VWRESAGWQRILSAADTASYIVRVAPDDPEVVYVAEKSGDTVYYTKDGGEEKWYTRTCSVPGGIQDLAVESSDVAYAIDTGGNAVKSTNSGFTWGPPTNTKLASGFSLQCISEDNLVAGSSNGFVAYSTDGNGSWTDIKKPVEAASGDVMVVADTDFANNNTVYAVRQVVSANVMKYVIGTSTYWEDIFRRVCYHHNYLCPQNL